MYDCVPPRARGERMPQVTRTSHVTRYSAVNLIAEAGVDPEQWNRMPDEATIQRTIKVVESRNIRVILAETGREGLDAVLSLIPEGAEVMNGSSTTLLEIGFDRVLAENPKGWRDYRAIVTAESDTEKRHALRRKSVTADYYLSGIQAVAESGEIVGCDKSGSRVGAWPYAAAHLILVSGVNKIVPTLDAALRRCREYALPIENRRAERVYGMQSSIDKYVILAREAEKGRTTLVLIRERLGY